MSEERSRDRKKDYGTQKGESGQSGRARVKGLGQSAQGNLAASLKFLRHPFKLSIPRWARDHGKPGFHNESQQR